MQRITVEDRALIVGIDPGNTCGVAAVDLEKNMVLLESVRELSDSEAIEMIIQEGKAVVVTSDKSKMPSKAEKISSSLGATRFEPEQDLSRNRKQRLGVGENSHEIDASASAINAYNQMSRRIEKIRERSGRREIERHEVAKEFFPDLGRQDI